MPSEIIVLDNNHSSSAAKKYLLRHDSLTVYALQIQNNGKDSMLFRCALPLKNVLPADDLLTLLSLKNQFRNACLEDGSEIAVVLIFGQRTKAIQLSSYYQENIGQLIRSLNQHLPQQHQIWYDKEELLLGQERCANAFSE